ncbi:AraC family transcriptional regulator [Seonamhaeicola sp.]|uniref:AraC family transcriptional regulator n=1 Tax=Seonamhaeicola sp. TaxID=1912245 RepID=UPI00260D7C18|nr:AraC family transcriptional regulator [Seonamhaeicola sp.]
MKKKKDRYEDFYMMYQPDRCEPLDNAANSGQLKMQALRRADYPGIDLPDHVLPGVYSIGYWDAKINQNWGLDWHRNEGIEFTFLESGNLTFCRGSNEQYELTSGDFTITRPWQPHKLGDPNVAISRLYWIIIDVGVRQPHQDWQWPDWIILAKEDLDFLTKVLRQNEMPVWKTNKKIRSYFTELGRCLDRCDVTIPHSKLNILVNELLLELVDLFKKDKIALDESLIINKRTVEIFLKHLETDYARYWSLDDMADYCGLGMTSLSKYCKELTNMTPVNYLINLRLEAAARMLKAREPKSISDICYDCGFSSTQYFATVFKKRFKCSPRRYKLGFTEEVSY